MNQVELPEAVWRGIHSGDENSLNYLVTKYEGELLGRASKKLRNWADAQDAVQLVFANLFSKLKDYRVEGRVIANVPGYLARSLKYAIIDIQRRSARYGSLTADGNEISDSAASAVAEMEKREVEDLLRDFVARLPVQLRACHRYLFQEGLTLRRTAELLGCSEKTCRKKREELEKRIWRCLEEQGFGR